jgi:acyl-CoA synthetase (AMP-forming)/AMP-acid ligase II/1-acyl-sn-glycerol-3-phosphate acyltransferase/acyl carrier protein
MESTTDIKSARGKFIAMAISYCLGVFNDNYFKQAAMLMAVSAGLSGLQGTATVLFALPFILFSSWAGWMADRFPKRGVVIWAKALELAAMLIGAVGVITTNWHCILAMVFLMGLQSTIFSPALNGSIPELYPVAYIPKANAILKLATTLSILVGIATAGLSLDRSPLHFDNLNPGTLMVAVVVVLMAAIGFLASFGVYSRPAAAKNKPFPWLGPLSSLKDMVSICADRQILIALFSDNFFYFLATIVVLTINTIGLKQLGFSQTVTSFLSMSLMLGVCVGSFLAAKLVVMDRWSRLLCQSAVGMAAGLFMAGATVLLPHSLRLAWIAVALTGTGVSGGLFLIPVASFLQVRPAASEKGRVLATVNFSGFVGIMFAGTLFTGLDSFFSPAVVMVCLGGFALFVAWIIHVLKNPKFNPIPSALQCFFRFIIGLRYQVEVRGLTAIGKDDGTGILFLPNHQALIDPVIVMSILYPDFQPRPLADADQANMAGNRWIMQQIRPITLPDPNKNGRDGKVRIKEALREVAQALLAGDNILLYPSGRLCRSAHEDLAGNSAVEYVLENVPGVRTVLVRTTGLWGSSLSWGDGTEPSLHKNIGRYIRFFCANLLFFGPRRKVTVELVEDTALPKMKGRQQINTALEGFYNARRQVNTHVPYYWWQGRKPVVLPEPEKKKVSGDIASVPETTRQLVIERITQLAGHTVSGKDRLANDLAMDSLTMMELAAWLESEFGLPVDDLSALVTVNDCILVAAGQVLHSSPATQKPVSEKWFRDSGKRLALDRHATITDLFLAQAKRTPNKIILADQLAGEKTYRQVITAVFVLKPILEKVQGDYVGIMMPASVSASILYFATLFSGKIPVMINWTTGVGNVQHGLDLTDVTTIVTARALYRKLTGQGVDLAAVTTDWLFLDEIVPTIPLLTKIRAALQARFAAGSLAKIQVSKTATILFTSGSEARPKAVPLSHENIIANLRDFSSIVSFTGDHRLLGMLPPFHSLGLVGTIIMPLCLGLKTVYHANPTESTILAGLIERYKVSIVIGTPTFLLGIIKAASKEQLQSLRLVFTGAEKCPENTYQALKKINSTATLCEGYGITECSPLVSINRVEDPRPGTIGQIMPSMEYAIIDPETDSRVEIGRQGILLVRGPNIFSGYHRDGNGAGFHEFDGRRWYNTGDFVKEDNDRMLTFCGRKKRFIKLGGEMISLPAIENVLLAHFSADNGNGPVLAVEATPTDERPEIVLFTTLAITREEANGRVKEAGLSPLHNIRIMREIDAIPVLGTGKTDYRLLQKMIAV